MLKECSKKSIFSCPWRQGWCSEDIYEMVNVIKRVSLLLYTEIYFLYLVLLPRGLNKGMPGTQEKYFKQTCETKYIR